LRTSRFANQTSASTTASAIHERRDNAATGDDSEGKPGRRAGSDDTKWPAFYRGGALRLDDMAKVDAALRLHLSL
jgi:hypothetical protein